MPRSKSYGPQVQDADTADPVLSTAMPVVSAQHAAAARSADVNVMEIVGRGCRNPDGMRTIVLSEWLGKGIDAWVWASRDALVAVLHARRLELPTVNGYGSGFKEVFRFITESRPVPMLADPSSMTSAHVCQFVAWLRAQAAVCHLRGDGVRTKYKKAKGALTLLLRQQVIRAEEKSWPCPRKT